MESAARRLDWEEPQDVAGADAAAWDPWEVWKRRVNAPDASAAPHGTVDTPPAATADSTDGWSPYQVWAQFFRGAQ